MRFLLFNMDNRFRPHALRGAVLLLLACMSLVPLWAATDYTVETIPNVRLTDRSNHVSNPDGILRQPDVMRINQWLNLLEDSLGIEVAVVAVERIGDNDAREFATDLFKHWGLGQKQRDNGLLIQLVTEPQQRSVVFETGYGIEGVLPDAICYRLQQRYMIPAMREGNYSQGMLQGVEAVSQYLLSSDYERGELLGESDDTDDWLIIGVSLLFLLSFIGLPLAIAALKYRKRICPQCGQKAFAYEGDKVIRKATTLAEGLSEEVYRCKRCGYTERHQHNTPRIRRSGGGGPIIMGGGGGGFSGGGGGFSGGSWGGGSSGGGGSISRF